VTTYKSLNEPLFPLPLAPPPGVHKCGNLSKDFQFSAPFVGPLPSQGFAKTMSTLDLDNVFPDMSPRIYHFRVDPLQPNRVWFTTRWVTHLG
jgi:hypothetical protein